jgi:hypothetical protein
MLVKAGNLQSRAVSVVVVVVVVVVVHNFSHRAPFACSKPQV